MSNPKKGDDTPGSEVPLDLGRRSFLQGAAGTAAASVGLGIPGLELLAHEHAQAKGPQGQKSGKNKTRLELRVNGKRVDLDVPHYRTLLLVLREDLGLTGTKKGCNLGQCGACTVLMDGAPIYACMMLAADAAGKEILTIEALERGGTLHPVQQAFIDAMGSQCGHCTPGMILSAVALLRENPQPTPEDVRRGLSGNLCRCGNYPNAITAVLLAAELEVSRWTNLSAAPALVYAPRTPPAHVSKAETGKPVRLLDSSRPALDAYAKVSGRARFTGDLGFHADDEVRETLVAKVIRSPYPHAEVLRIDDSQAWHLAGYRGMVTWADVPSYRNDRRFLNRHARYVGDAVAAIAADDQYTAQEALKLLDVQWRELPVYPDAEYNLSHDVRAIHEDGCVAGFDGPQPADVPTIEYRDGNLEVGFEAADLIVEGRFVTPVHCHAPSEPHCCIASLRGGKLTVWDSQQSVFHARAVLAEALHLEPDNIRVVCEYLGGGFGGKCLDTLGKTLYQGIAATLSRMTARPVRLEYTLKETLLAEDARNPFIFILRTGVKRDGTLTAMQCKAIQATGGYASTGPGVVAVGGEGIINTYRCDNYWFQGYSVYTNSPVGGEFRGFGHPQAVFARERHMDDIARRLGINPLVLRRRNSKRTGDPVTLGVATNTPLDNIGAQQCMTLGAEAINWGRWQPPGSQSGRHRCGLGMRVSQEHTGRSHSDALIWVDRHGQVHLPLGVGNLGTHAATGIALIAAEALHMPVEAINVSWGDTADAAWDFVTDASRSIHCTGKAVYNAAQDLAGQLKALAAKILKVDRGQLVLRDDRVLVAGSQRFVDFRTLARRAPLRSSFLPVFEAATDRNPLIDENTGVLHQAPAMRLHPATERLARAVATKGGLVGLGHYVFNPGVQAWGASFAEVEVDVETGQVNVLKLVCAHDIGRIIYRKGAEAQVYGGTIMGFGYAMMEELVCDPHHHVPLNASLYELRIPTVLDYPDIVSILVEAPVAAGPFGAKGLGENPMFNAAAAIGNAIHNATGVPVHELPFNWPRMYRALETLRLSPRDKTLSLPSKR